ncbi:MAG: sodium:solute symporter [Rikenellaceae bacterium]
MTTLVIGVTFASYIMILLGVAWYSARQVRNTDYFVAGRKVRWQMAAMAMVAAAMSGITFVSVPGSVGADSFSYMQMTLGFTVGQAVIAFVLIPLFYRLRVVSLYQYLDDRFGSTSHKSGAWIFFLSKTTIAALRIYIMCTVMQALLFDHLGVPFGINALLTVAVVWLATRRGGVKSLIWTDSLKTICLVGSLVLSIIFISSSLGWGFMDSVSHVFDSSYSRIFFFDDPSSPYYFWKMFLAGVFSLVAMTGLDQDMMQCNLSCVNRRHAQVNIMVTALCQIFVILLFLILGALLYIYAEHNAIALPDKSDQLFSLIAVNGGLPTVVGILFILGLSSSTLSSAASSLTALTTSFTVDLLGAEGMEESRLTRLRLRVHSALAAIIVLLIMIVGRLSDQSVINTLFKFVGYAYGPILGMFSFGILTKFKIHDKWIAAVAAASILISAVSEWTLLHAYGYKTGFEILIYNASITIIGMFLIRKR